VDLNLRDCLDLFSIIAIEDIRLVDARPRFQQHGAVIVALNNPETRRLNGWSNSSPPFLSFKRTGRLLARKAWAKVGTRHQ